MKTTKYAAYVHQTVILKDIQRKFRNKTPENPKRFQQLNTYSSRLGIAPSM